MDLRPETNADIRDIRELVTVAFEPLSFSDGSEPDIVDRLRARGELVISLVAVRQDRIVGYIAISPVRPADGTVGWFGLGPLAVQPDVQRTGIGSALVLQALEQLKASGASGCVVLGDPAYYGQFGFRADETMTYEGEASPYFQALPFVDQVPSGDVAFSSAFAP